MFQAILNWGQRVDFKHHLLMAFFVTPLALMALMLLAVPELISAAWLDRLADAEFHWQTPVRSTADEPLALAYRQCVQKTTFPPGATLTEGKPHCAAYGQFSKPALEVVDDWAAVIRTVTLAWIVASAMTYPLWRSLGRSLGQSWAPLGRLLADLLRRLLASHRRF